MRQVTTVLTVNTPGAGLHEITEGVRSWAEAQAIGEGLLTLFIRHTSASLVIQENADPAVRHDLDAFFHRLVAEDTRLYLHQDEGPDDMPAHIRAALTASHLSIPLLAGCLALGTWQGIYLFEHRHRPHPRQLVLHLLGE
ncbi:secondary thiamine-phosphate synthase enzyme YjbQ [Telmatospirillum sp.]|uniref:secondary thiamine-phosphate synthase enzyme YjbQ n=1 Tax=Telmatospirillum sp. TaxID=2079197 RepID=UPI002851C916|nr:secondary thiamine-phosphate synthase enzyme YjbQ [Telmatospirillum sp.]MDR3436990.1 secondary thiamine-phosphate synthase enzyme YjbQ [Telmatospirillum sp.]